jgi:nucleoside-diphosphate-sugar epimerase
LKKKLLITGINGYLGSKLAYRYKDNYHVIGLEYDLSNLSRLEEGLFEVYASKDGIPDSLFENHDIDFIIHTATFYGREKESNSKMLYANTFLPQVLLEKAVHNHCELFINTDTVLNRFTSAYALTKKQFRDWLEFYTNQHKIKVVNLSLEHFYGPGTSDTNFITLMIRKMLKNEPSIPLTKAEQNRDFLYVDDLLRVYDKMLEVYHELDFFEDYQVGYGENTNLKEILEFIKHKTNSTSTLDYGAIPYRTNELMNSNVDISALKKLGWSPNVEIKDGLIKIIRYEKHRKSR